MGIYYTAALIANVHLANLQTAKRCTSFMKLQRVLFHQSVFETKPTCKFKASGVFILRARACIYVDISDGILEFARINRLQSGNECPVRHTPLGAVNFIFARST